MWCRREEQTSGVAAGGMRDTPAKGFPPAAGAVREIPAKGLLAVAAAAPASADAAAPGCASAAADAVGGTAGAAPRRALKMRRCFSTPSSARLNSPAITCPCKFVSSVYCLSSG